MFRGCWMEEISRGFNAPIRPPFSYAPHSPQSPEAESIIAHHSPQKRETNLNFIYRIYDYIMIQCAARTRPKPTRCWLGSGEKKFRSRQRCERGEGLHMAHREGKEAPIQIFGNTINLSCRSEENRSNLAPPKQYPLCTILFILVHCQGLMFKLFP